MLAAVRFPVHAQQGAVDPAIMRHLALLYLPTAAILAVISILVLLLYGIDQKKHEQNLATLAEQGLANLTIPPGDVPIAPSIPILEAEAIRGPAE